MTTLLEKIKSERITAMKEKDAVKKQLLTTLIGEFERTGKLEDLSEEQIISSIKKILNNLNEMLDIYRQSRNDVAIFECESEIDVLESFLPKQLSEDDLRDIIAAKSIVLDLDDPKFQGEMNKYLKQNFAGLYDGKLANEIIREYL